MFFANLVLLMVGVSCLTLGIIDRHSRWSIVIYTVAVVGNFLCVIDHYLTKGQ